MSVIVGDGNCGEISKQGQEDDQVGTDGLVNDDHRCGQVDLQVQTESNTILHVSLHTLENLTGNLDSIDDRAETRGKEDDIGGGLGGFGGTLDSDTTVRFLQRWSVVDTVTSHGSQVTSLLKHFNDLILVFWEDFGETVSLLDEVVLSRASNATSDETLRVVDFGTESEELASFLGDGDGITSQHLDAETEILGFQDSVGSVISRRVKHGQHANDLPWFITTLRRNTKRSETTTSKVSCCISVVLSCSLVTLGNGEHGFWCTLAERPFLTLEGADSGDTLGDRVEWHVFLSLPPLLQDLTGLWISLQCQDSNLVNGIKSFQVVRGSEGGTGHHPVDIFTLCDVGFTNGQLVGSQSTSLVGAQNIDTLQHC